VNAARRLACEPGEAVAEDDRGAAQALLLHGACLRCLIGP
jgi:hypothetical protein